MASTHEISMRVTSQISVHVYIQTHTQTYKSMTNVWNVRAMPVRRATNAVAIHREEKLSDAAEEYK